MSIATIEPTSVPPTTLALPEADFSQIQSRFIDKVSHEMRTPLTSLKLSLGILDDNMPAGTPAPLGHLVKNALKSAARLEAAISDLLDLAHLESGQLRLQLMDSDLAEVIIQATDLARPLVEEKGQTISVVVPHTPCPARFDPARLRQVLLHLLNNAVKYTPSGGEIKVELRQCMGEYCIAMRDNGCGVKPAQQQTIFQRFYVPEHDSGVLGYGGGLGLPLARALVELHGGQLSVASTGIPGDGSIFYFNLPFRRNHN